MKINLKFAAVTVLSLAALAAGCNKNAPGEASAPPQAYTAASFTADQVTRGAGGFPHAAAPL